MLTIRKIIMLCVTSATLEVPFDKYFNPAFNYFPVRSAHTPVAFFLLFFLKMEIRCNDDKTAGQTVKKNGRVKLGDKSITIDQCMN